MKKKVLAVIPARMASTRFPRKALALIGERPMVHWVYEQALSCPAVDEAIVATDSTEIEDVVVSLGGRAIMTSDQHPSGLDRIIEVAEQMPDYSHYVNVQGDEPGIAHETIAGVVAMFDNPSCQIASSATPFRNERDYHNPNQVKVVLAADGRALYFSRAPIPAFRDSNDFDRAQPLKHQGIYGYTGAVLHQIKDLERTVLEDVEKLEQLRFLYHGIDVYLAVSQQDSIGVDTPEDLERVVTDFKSAGKI